MDIWYERDVPISIHMHVDHWAPSYDDVLPTIRNGDLTAPKHVEVVDLTWTEPEEELRDSFIILCRSVTSLSLVLVCEHGELPGLKQLLERGGAPKRVLHLKPPSLRALLPKMIHLSILLCAKLALSLGSLTLGWKCVTVSLPGLLFAFVFPYIINLTIREIDHKDVADVVFMLRECVSAVECLQLRFCSLPNGRGRMTFENVECM